LKSARKKNQAGNHLTTKKPGASGELARLFIERKEWFLLNGQRNGRRMAHSPYSSSQSESGHHWMITAASTSRHGEYHQHRSRKADSRAQPPRRKNHPQ
jgi:hypothetical protein